MSGKLDSPNKDPEAQPLSFETFERTAKVIAALAIGLYALGLLISNQYLRSLGISDFSTLRPKFILTGAWAFALFLTSASPALAPILYGYVWGLPKKYQQFRFAALMVMGIAVGIALDLFVLSFLVERNDVFSRNMIKYVVRELLFPACLGIFALSQATKQMSAIDRTNRQAAKGRRITIALFLAIVLVSLLIFGARIVDPVYRFVPDAQGGAYPVFAQLYLNKDGARLWRNMEAIICTCSTAESTITGNVSILYQNEHELLVMTYKISQDKNGKHPPRIVTLRKELLDGIVLVQTPEDLDLQQQ
ncbi:MAG: hypothetical protein LAO20_14745 [Acidobacteriia bacterium]|nr:hypothetical protein [Terriglobia bacterium]